MIFRIPRGCDSSLSTPRSHIASVDAFFCAMYSASVDDRATEDRFFDAQLIAPPAVFHSMSFQHLIIVCCLSEDEGHSGSYDLHS